MIGCNTNKADCLTDFVKKISTVVNHLASYNIFHTNSKLFNNNKKHLDEFYSIL